MTDAEPTRIVRDTDCPICKWPETYVEVHGEPIHPARAVAEGCSHCGWRRPELEAATLHKIAEQLNDACFSMLRATVHLRELPKGDLDVERDTADTLDDLRDQLIAMRAWATHKAVALTRLEPPIYDERLDFGSRNPRQRGWCRLRIWPGEPAVVVATDPYRTDPNADGLSVTNGIEDVARRAGAIAARHGLTSWVLVEHYPATESMKVALDRVTFNDGLLPNVPHWQPYQGPPIERSVLLAALGERVHEYEETDL